MSKVRRTHTGKVVSPYHASRRYAAQNKKGTKKIKNPITGDLEEKKLTPREKAFRAGYTTATGDMANKWKEKNGIPTSDQVAGAFASVGKN